MELLQNLCKSGYVPIKPLVCTGGQIVLLLLMEFLSVSDESLGKAAAVIKNGGLAAFPTETVYGLGADAFNPAALAKIFEAKGRPRFDPLIIHIADVQTLKKIADLSLLSGAAQEKLSLLAETLWPGPLTLILPKQKAVPDLATSGLATVAVRFPAHPGAQKLIALSGGALAAPSANPFGYLSPTCAGHVRDQLGNKVDIILDGGGASVGVESTVLDICGERPRILRPGGVPREAIESLIGGCDTCVGVIGDSESGGQEEAMAAPGMLRSHYAPSAQLAVWTLEEILALPDTSDGNTAFLFFDCSARSAWQAGKSRIYAVIRTLCEHGDLKEAAANLFKTLHELDKPGIARINAQLAPEKGLGVAINDRLRRASLR